MSPNKVNLRKWVEALRSGEYAQGRKSLGSVTKLGDGTEIRQYCCLGVACEVAIANGVVVNRVEEEFGHTYIIEYDRRAEYLPDSVRVWLGLWASDPSLRGVDASRLNDEYGYSFERIAQAIEETFGLNGSEVNDAAQ